MPHDPAPHDPTPHDPIPGIPGAEHVIRALRAEGDATELTGRQAIVTMFRAARDQATTTHRPDVPPSRQVAGQQAPGPPGPRRRRAGRVVVAAVLAVCAALAAAAYARVLPGPVQNIAHSALAPLGVPSARPARPSPTSPGQGPAPAVTPTAGGTGPAPSASGPGPATAATGSMRLTAAKAHVAADGPDSFTGHVVKNGHPARGVRVRLLEQLSVDVGAWRVATTGITGTDGAVTVAVAHIPANATFRLAGTGPLADVISPAVTVTVTPRVVIQQPATGTLAVTALPTATGDAVVLLQLENGTWVTVATGHLSAAHKATFTVRPGASYRVLLPATALHAYSLSARITAVKR